MTRLALAHGLALSNLPVFVAQEYGLFVREQLEVEFLPPKSVGHLAALIRDGQAQVASGAFTTLMALRDEGVPISVVGGAGILGLALLGHAELAGWRDIRGRRVGTLRKDLLEILLYEALLAHDITYTDVEIEYFSHPSELNTAFLQRKVDVVTQLYPYAADLTGGGRARILSDGRDLWGPRYPDCVIAARLDLIEWAPHAVKALLRALLHAQAAIEENPERACRMTAGKYFPLPHERLHAALALMPPCVDIRDQAEVITGRAPAMKALRYLQRDLPADFINFALLHEVISENRDVWVRLAIRSPDAPMISGDLHMNAGPEPRLSPAARREQKIQTTLETLKRDWQGVSSSFDVDLRPAMDFHPKP